LEAALDLGVRPILGDIRDAELVSQIVPEFDGVINLAGLLGTAEMMDDPVPAIGTNIIGAVNVFQACRRAARLGRPVTCVQITAAHHFMENPYSITKSTAERFARMFNTGHGTDIRIVRALNVYGEYQKNYPVRKVVPNFVRAALAGEPLQVYGTGEQIMDLIYAGDVARILVHTLFADRAPELVSAGTGRPLSVRQVARMVIDAAGSASEIVHAPMRAGEPEHSVVVGEPETLSQIGIRAEDLLPFETGIQKTIAWYRQNPGFLA
jgi:nucleoside-diphosphate-sugar epimerase